MFIFSRLKPQMTSRAIGFRKLIRDFANWTTCHGVNHIVSSHHLVLSVFWFVCVVGSAIFFGWQLINLLTKFLGYPSTVQTNVQFDAPKFPAVTVCNYNPMKYSQAKQFAPFADLFNNLDMALRGNASGTNPIYGFSNDVDDLTILNFAKESFYGLRNSMNSSFKNNAQYSLNDLIIDCTYKGHICNNVTDWTVSNSREYGACYTFNAQGIYLAQRAGPAYGLRLTLRLDSSEYLPISEVVGAKVRLSEPHASTYTGTYGRNVDVGFETNIAMTASTNARLDSPWGTCVDRNNIGSVTHFYTGLYTVEGCYRSCFQLAVNAKCNCYDNRFTRKPGSSLTDCANSAASFACADELLRYPVSKWNPMTECHCPKPCTETDNTQTLSLARWPPMKYTPSECSEPTAYAKYNLTDNTAAGCCDWYRHNTAVVMVYFSQTFYQEFTQTASYGISNLINEIGGNLGLALGASIITICEGLSLIVLSILFCIRRNRLKKLVQREQMAKEAAKQKQIESEKINPEAK